MRTFVQTLVLSSAAVAAWLTIAACGENETVLPPLTPYDGGIAPLSCVPNLDGKIEAREATPALGVPATFLVSPQGRERAVNVAGFSDAQGRLAWDFGSSFADDQAAKIQATSTEGKWFQSSFPAGAFVTPFDAGGTTFGIYTFDDAALRLHGVASAVMDPPEGKTLLVYETPIDVLRFPLVPGAAWISTSNVRNSTFRGLPYAGRDKYEFRVDGAGKVTLPDLVVTQALRVRSLYTAEPSAGQTTTQRQVLFLFECIGEVARVTSKNNETNEDFATAAELRRLGLVRQ